MPRFQHVGKPEDVTESKKTSGNQKSEDSENTTPFWKDTEKLYMLCGASGVWAAFRMIFLFGLWPIEGFVLSLPFFYTAFFSKKGKGPLVGVGLLMLLLTIVPDISILPQSFRVPKGTLFQEDVQGGQGTEEQSTIRGEVVETLSLPPATQLPTTWTFSSSGRLEVQGKYRLQLQGGRYAEFDVKNGDYVESDGYVGNELPSSNVSQYLAPDLSVGLLIIRSQDGRWYKADQFDVIPGVQYELALNSNQDYPQYVTYLQPPEITVLSQE